METSASIEILKKPGMRCRGMSMVGELRARCRLPGPEDGFCGFHSGEKRLAPPPDVVIIGFSILKSLFVRLAKIGIPESDRPHRHSVSGKAEHRAELLGRSVRKSPGKFAGDGSEVFIDPLDLTDLSLLEADLKEAEMRVVHAEIYRRTAEEYNLHIFFGKGKRMPEWRASILTELVTNRAHGSVHVFANPEDREHPTETNPGSIVHSVRISEWVDTTPHKRESAKNTLRFANGLWDLDLGPART